MNRNISIAVVEDHKLLKAGISILLELKGYHISGQYENGKNFIERITADHLQQVVFTDLNIPEMDGYDFALWLTGHYPAIHVVGLCVNEDVDAVQRFLINGARGFLYRDADPYELTVAVKTVLKNRKYFADFHFN